MYGRQSEIQRIQSKLQRIGQSNPHRAVELDQDAFQKGSEPGQGTEDLADLSLEQEAHESDSGESFVSTRDRYSSPAGQQALQEMEKVVEQPHPFPDAVTFFPQHSWPQQIQPVNNEVRQNIHQLADTLRQPFQVQQQEVNPSYEQSSQDFVAHYGGHSDSTAAELWPSGWSLLKARPRFTMSQGLVWLVGSIVVRVGIDRLLLVFPHLWIVMAAVVLTPVAIALYQTAVNPQSTVHSGRRLLVIMMGLLIGGQL